MTTQNIITILFSLLLGLSGWLIKYVINKADKQNERNVDLLSSIKDIMSEIKTEISLVKKDVETTNKITQTLSGKVEELTKHIYEMRVTEAALLEWRKGVEKQLEEVYKRLNIKKLP